MAFDPADSLIADLWQRLRGQSQAQRLKRARAAFSSHFATYPPVSEPWRAADPTPALPGASAGQADPLSGVRANLAWLNANVDHRLAILQRFVGQTLGLDLAAIAREPDRDWREAAEVLHQWMVATVDGMPRGAYSTWARWRRSDRQGEAWIYSLLGDIAIWFGEVIRSRRPEYFWAVDDRRLPGDDQEQASTYGRVILSGPLPRSGDEEWRVRVDLDAIIVHDYLHAGSPNVRLINHWAGVTVDVLEGGFDEP